MSEIAKDECKKLQLQILTGKANDSIETEIFKVLDEITLTSTTEATVPISLLLTYVTYSKHTQNFSTGVTEFIIKLLHSDLRSIREMTFVIISSLKNTETLKSVFENIATRFQTLSHRELALLLTFSFDFEEPSNEPWKALIEPARTLFDDQLFGKKARRFVEYMEKIQNKEQEEKKIHAHHKVPASQFTPDFVNENSNTCHQYIHMLRDYDWHIQIKAVEGLTNVINTHPELLANNAKTALINLMDVINCPRTMVKSAGEKLALQLINHYTENIAVHSGKYIELAFGLCDNTLDFIANDAIEILNSLSVKLPREFVLKDLAEGCKDENKSVRACAAHCFSLMAESIDKKPASFVVGEKEYFVGGPLDDNEFYTFVKSLLGLIRDNEESTRIDSRKVLKMLMKDQRFNEVSHNVIPASDDYDMIMSDLAKF